MLLIWLYLGDVFDVCATRDVFDVCATRDVFDVLGVESPFRATGPRLALPDRHRRLQRVDAEPSRLECIVAVGSRRGHDDRRCTDVDASRPMEHSKPASRRPSPASFGRDGLETGHDLLFIGLVLQHLDFGSPLGVVARGARKHHDRPTVRPHGPVGHPAHGQRLIGERQPCVAVDGGLEHRVMLGGTAKSPPGGVVDPEGAVTAARPIGNLPDVEVDEGPEEEPSGFRQPLPPSDRIWRHPSEVGTGEPSRAMGAPPPRDRDRRGQWRSPRGRWARASPSACSH